MRHNARISIKSVEADGPQELHLFISSFASPNELKVLSRKAIRNMRRQFDSERFYINLIRLSRGQVNIFPLAATYLWEYEFNFRLKIPKLTITHSTNEFSRTVGLFRWLGPERKPGEDAQPARDLDYAKKGRGRPSNLSRGLSSYAVPAPKEVLPDGTVIFGDARDQIAKKEKQNG